MDWYEYWKVVQETNERRRIRRQRAIARLSTKQDMVRLILFCIACGLVICIVGVRW